MPAGRALSGLQFACFAFEFASPSSSAPPRPVLVLRPQTKSPDFVNPNPQVAAGSRRSRTSNIEDGLPQVLRPQTKSPDFVNPSPDLAAGSLKVLIRRTVSYKCSLAVDRASGIFDRSDGNHRVQGASENPLRLSEASQGPKSQSQPTGVGKSREILCPQLSFAHPCVVALSTNKGHVGSHVLEYSNFSWREAYNVLFSSPTPTCSGETDNGERRELEWRRGIDLPRCIASPLLGNPKSDATEKEKRECFLAVRIQSNLDYQITQTRRDDKKTQSTSRNPRKYSSRACLARNKRQDFDVAATSRSKFSPAGNSARGGSTDGELWEAKWARWKANGKRTGSGNGGNEFTPMSIQAEKCFFGGRTEKEECLRIKGNH
ncbi:hypothetical protein WN55_00135 [Dufourea novaeangliae]|uniref:Uncharacterized protein n=1 Tax=Dufourea novaeangliae TaxID=178035 RepID=A0A154PCB5_DUFNO|nr:hypothetical protein WN55_00135 [Dufourea novaeangliae]